MRLLRYLTAVLATLIVALATTGQPAQANPYGPQYQNLATGKCLDLKDLWPHTFGTIQQWSCLNNKNQAWVDADPVSGFIVFKNPAVNMCISTFLGRNHVVTTTDCDATDSYQRWFVQRYTASGKTVFHFRNVAYNDMCLDQFGPSPNDGGSVGAWTCGTASTKNQLWY
jgi:hypothetical protein